MARANPELINVLRQAAKNLKNGDRYEWGHMGSCNCGHVAQVVCKVDKAEIHKRAMQRYGDWNEQLIDYCPTSGVPMDDLIDQLLAIGLTTTDLKSLEKLNDPNILRRLPVENRYLKHNRRDDVILYLETWAGMLEEAYIKTLDISSVSHPLSFKTVKQVVSI